MVDLATHDANKKVETGGRSVWLVVAGIMIAFLTALWQSNKGTTKSVDVNSPTPTSSVSATITVQKKEEEKVTELKIEDLKVGTGAEAVAGKKVTVNYLGTLTDGTKFDSSYDRGTPFSFNLGTGVVIKGWDLGVAGMKEGGKRKLTIPSSLGYGTRGAGALIPPNATLVFEVELLKVE